MDDDQPRKDADDASAASRDDLDTQAILARRRAFVASALAGMSLSAASCEGSVSGSVSGSASGSIGESTSGSTGSNSANNANSAHNPNNPNNVIVGVCLMISNVSEDAADTDATVSLTELADAGAITAQPCLMVYVAPDASAPTLPSGPGAVAVPCLSMPAPMDAGTRTSPQACLRMAPPRRDAGAPVSAVDAGTGRPVRDASVRVPTPVPCLEMAVPRPCLTPARPKPHAAYESDDDGDDGDH
jgi:hypothetical protein